MQPDSNMQTIRSRIGESLYERQRSSTHLCVPLDGGGYYLAFRWRDVRDTHKKEERVCVLCEANRLLVAGDSPRCMEARRAIPGDLEPYHALAEFFFELTADDLDALERIERDINELEDAIITAKKLAKDASGRIVAQRRALLRIKRYYEQLATLVDRLLENERHEIPDDAKALLCSLSRRLDRLIEMVTHLRECVTQVREAYQAQIDIEQNQIMKFFTVITTVFLPLTLIVGWYGMNFEMPEYEWPIGYLYVALLSAAVCAGCFWSFKRKKWF